MKIDVIDIQPWNPNGEQVSPGTASEKIDAHHDAGHGGSYYYCQECIVTNVTSTIESSLQNLYVHVGDQLKPVEGVETVTVTLTTANTQEEKELPNFCPVCAGPLRVHIIRQYSEIFEVGKLTQLGDGDDVSPLVVVHPSDLEHRFTPSILKAWLYCADDRDHFDVEWGDDDNIIFDIAEEEQSESTDLV